MSQHSYLVKSVLKSTAVHHAVTGSFSRPGAIECVLAKVTALELAVLSEDGSLLTLCEQPVFGSISDIQLLPWNDGLWRTSLPACLVGCDLLVLLSDSSDLAFVGFERERHRFVHVGHVDLQNELGFSRTRLPARLSVDPLGRAVAVAGESEPLVVFQVSRNAGAKLLERIWTSAAPDGLGYVTWDAIVSVAFVRPSDEDVINGLLKLAVIVRIPDTPGHEVLILFHDTRDKSTRLWARLPAAVNVCPSADNFLPVLVFAPPRMPDTLLIGRAGDLVALDLTLKGPVVKATWALERRTVPTPGEDPGRQSEGLGVGEMDTTSNAVGVRIRTDARRSGNWSKGNAAGTGLGETRIRLGEMEQKVGWELDLRSPDAEKTRVAKRRARLGKDRPGDPSDVSFGDWNEYDAEADESSNGVKEGPSMCAWAWRSNGSETSETIALSLFDGGLQTLEIRRALGTNGWDLKFVEMSGCDGDTCQACNAVAWFGDESVGAFVAGGDGMVLQMERGVEMAPVAEIPNAAPIVDFQLADPSEEPQKQLFACCGDGPTASLRTIRPGITAERLLSTPPAYKGVAGLWAMRMSPCDPHHAFLVMAFVSETRVLSVGLSFDDVTESVGFQQDTTTLACGPITDRHVVQICAQAVHLCSPTAKAHPSGIPSGQPHVATWRPPNGARISVGAVGTNRAIVGLSRPSGLVMLGLAPRGASSGRHVALVQLQSCRLDSELSCISLQDGGDVSGPSGDFIGPSGDVRGPSGDVSGPSNAVNGPQSDVKDCANRPLVPTGRLDRALTSYERFVMQAEEVCVVGTYRPSVEVFSVLPGDGFRLLASIPLSAGTSFQRKGISPLSLPHKSDVSVRLMSPISGCVPESVLLSFFDRGYLLVGLRNGVLARYEWPTGHMERALSARGIQATDPGEVRGVVGTGLGKAVGSPGLEGGLAESIHTEPVRMDGRSVAGASTRSPLLQKETGVEPMGIADMGASDSRSDGASCAASDAPITFKQAGEKRLGSAPVSLRTLSYSDGCRQKADAFAQNSAARARDSEGCQQYADGIARDSDAPAQGASGRHSDGCGREVDAFARQPDASGRDSDVSGRESNASMGDPDAFGRQSDAQNLNPDASLPMREPFTTDSFTEVPKPTPDIEAPGVSTVDSDVLALSNQPWLLHRSSRGRGRMMTSLVSHPTSSHATAVSCEECPRGIVFITDCCMHLVELDANKKSDVRKLSSTVTPRRILYHPPSKTLLTAGHAPAESPGHPKPAIQCIDPETGVVLCSATSFTHDPSEECVSLSFWTVRNSSYVVVGTARKSYARGEGSPTDMGPLVDPETEPALRGSLYVFRYSFSGRGPTEVSGSQSGFRSTGCDTGNFEVSDNRGGSKPGLRGGGSGDRLSTRDRRNSGNGNGDHDGPGNGYADYKLECLTVRLLPGPVLATCPLSIGPPGRAYLAAAAGCHVYVFSCAASPDGPSRLQNAARARTRFPVVALSPGARGPRLTDRCLIVGDSSDGVLLYRVAPNLDLLLSDKERRELSDVIAAPGDVLSAAVAADYAGGIGVMSSPGINKSPERNLNVDAWFNFGEPPTRLRFGASFDDETLLRSVPAGPNDDSAPGRDAFYSGKAVFVSTACGGVHLLAKAPPLEHEFLILVQESLARFPATAPLMGNDYATFRSKGTRAKTRSVLEVDFLTQFLDLTESEQLAVLAAARAPLAASYSRLVGDEAGKDGILSGVDGCECLRQLAAVLIENL